MACVERFHVIILRKAAFLIAGDGVSHVILFCGSVVNVFLSHISYAWYCAHFAWLSWH